MTDFLDFVYHVCYVLFGTSFVLILIAALIASMKEW